MVFELISKLAFFLKGPGNLGTQFLIFSELGKSR
jgi:hypothetical protein